MPVRPASFTDRAALPVTLLMQAAASAAVVAPPVAASALPAARSAGPLAVGLYVAIVYIAAMVSSQWGVALVRRWGPIRTSQASLLCCAAGVALLAAPSPLVALAGAALLGLGYGPVTPASSEMLARTTPPHRYALVFSLKQTGVPLGGALAGALVPVVLTRAGAGWALGQIAALCVLGAVLAVPLRAALDTLREPAASWPTLRGALVPIRFVLERPALRRIALCTLVLSGVQVSLTSYLVAYLHQDLLWSLVAAGLGLTVAQVAGMAGRVAWGLAADRIGDGSRRTLRGLACAMAVCGLALPLLTPGVPPAAILVLLAVYGGTAVGWNGVYLASVARAVPRAEAAMATGGSMAFTYLGVVLAPPVFGAVAQATGRVGPAYALLALPLALVLFWLRPPRG
ncbi:MFS transporter [uncultured Xylophilus sp.]|uniref:MFS transporter n=1 Tax=uncultured Xylophilus sp. TaxID=296832 RepID=UPI0025F7E1C2|nr:MFS transporter [uncultured Xylophilus sp.]